MTSGVRRIDFATDDRDAAADAIEGAFGFRARLSGRDIGFRQQTLTGQDVSYTELHFGADLRTTVEPNPGIVVSEVPRGRYALGGGRSHADLSDGGLFLLPIGTPMRVELDHTVTRTYHLGTITELRRLAADVAPESPALDLGRLRPISPAAERHLRESLALYRRHFLGESPVDSPLAAAEGIRHLLVTTVAAFGLLACPDRVDGQTTSLRRARDHVAAHLDEPLAVADLAHAAGTGVRSLQLAFRRELGVTPLEYVRDERMRAARAELLAAPGAPVTAIAQRWGFTNPGRFSAHYRRLFGEYPRDTRRQA